jgi:plastin-3
MTLRQTGNSIGSLLQNRSSVTLAADQIDELKEKFLKLDLNGNGTIELNELRSALKVVGIDIPGYEERLLIEQFKSSDANKDGKLSFEEFEKLYSKMKSEKDGRSNKQVIKNKVENSSKVIKNEDTGIVHTIKHSEQLAFSKWINENLSSDSDLGLATNPINPETSDLYTKCSDGLLLCKLINFSVPKTIDERSLNKGKINNYQQLENLELALRSAEAIGCHVINMRPSDIKEGIEHLILGLLWQIIKIGLFSEINLTHHPGLVFLLKDGETKEDLLKLTKEELLLRWMNYHLAKSGYTGKEVKNFSSDIKDSVAYTYLLKQIAPHDTKPPLSLAPLNESDVNKRAELMLNEADKLKAREFVTASDVVQGNPKLNMAFVANLFNIYPALDAPEAQPDEPVIEETREEKMYRNWMNSMGVKPFVNYIYEDLSTGLIYFQLYDTIKPNSVNWKRVNDEAALSKAMKQKINFLILDNCNYAVELGKQANFKLVGIQGSNLQEKNKLFTLALVWQLMRAYILSLLQKLSSQGNTVNENTIVEWTNNKLKSAGKKTFIQSFQDPVIVDSRVICDLIDSIKPNSIKFEALKTDTSYESRMDNARYAVSMARKIGARVFALPEDIVEGKQKMIMTIFATLMIVGEQASVTA